MRRANEYESKGKYRNYTIPSSKPFKFGAFNYQEKKWTLQEQIYNKLDRIKHFVGFLMVKSTSLQNKPTYFKKSIESLHKDLDLLKGSIEKNPFDFNTQKLNINEHWITEMKNISDNLKQKTSDKVELKTLRKLTHNLSELDHLIKQGLSEVNMLKKKTNGAKVKKVVRKPAKKATAATTKRKPAAKSAAAKAKTTVAKKKPAVKKAKPATKAAAVRKPATKTTAKRTPAKKTVARKPAAKKTSNGAKKATGAKRATSAKKASNGAKKAAH